MGQAPKVAIACCRATPTAPDHELYPDADSDLLVAELRSLELDASKVAWDDANTDWSMIDVVVTRSTWDGTDRAEEFVRWTKNVGAQTTLLNPAPIVEWNIDKRYLQDLEAEGIATIPTLWVSPGASWEPPAAEFIVKPAIASGARNTARYSATMRDAADEHVALLGELGQTTLIQQYLRSVEDRGETSLIFIDGQFSHAIRKGGFLNLDEGVLERPWERMTYLGRCEPSTAELALANRTFALAEQRSVEPLLYGRVDLVADDVGDPVVIEMELIDPFLSLSAARGAARTMAVAIAKRMS